MGEKQPRLRVNYQFHVLYFEVENAFSCQVGNLNVLRSLVCKEII